MLRGFSLSSLEKISLIFVVFIVWLPAVFDRQGNLLIKTLFLAFLSEGRGLLLFDRLLFDENMIKMARKPGKKQNENPLECTGKGKR